MAEDTPSPPEARHSDASLILVAFLQNPHTLVPAGDLPDLIRQVYAAVGAPAASAPEEAAPAAPLTPAVPIDQSVSADHLICLEDGAKMKMLKRYLRSRFDMSPEEYRARWGLAADYPMVAPSYSQNRSEFAKRQGLGHRQPAAPAARRRKS